MAHARRGRDSQKNLGEFSPVARSVAAVLLLALTSLALLTAPTAAAQPAEPPASTGPDLTVATAVINESVVCLGNSTVLPRTPTLLVPGLSPGGVAELGRLVPYLTGQGHTACMVQMPAEKYEDPAALSEYVVHVIRAMALVHGEKINVVAHRDGAALTLGALHRWPDAAPLVGDLISLSPTLTAPTLVGTGCGFLCPELVRALTASPVDTWFAQFPTTDPVGPSHTVVIGIGDPVDLVRNLAEPADRGPNTTTVRLGELCGLGTPIAGSVTGSGVVGLLISDAFDHEGGADPQRLPPQACAAPLERQPL